MPIEQFTIHGEPRRLTYLSVRWSDRQGDIVLGIRNTTADRSRDAQMGSTPTRRGWDRVGS